jgi:hypothetical protein
VDADVSLVSGLALNLVLSKPVISALVEQDAATVGIDVDSVVVGPEAARNEPSRFIVCGGSALGSNQMKYQGGTNYQVRQFLHDVSYRWRHVIAIDMECQAGLISRGEVWADTVV